MTEPTRACVRTSGERHGGRQLLVLTQAHTQADIAKFQLYKLKRRLIVTAYEPENG
jgi:hypothetical protein